MKVQRSHSVGLAALGCSMVLLSGNFVGGSAHQGGCINSFLGDGWCDFTNNNEDCSYDDGDCCEDSCVSSTYVCGEKAEYNCLDPEYYPHQSMSYTFSCDDGLAGNGDCDSDNNVEDCGYDGGDCCYCTCTTTGTDEYTCGGGSGYDCVDPYASCVNDEDGYVEAGYSTNVGVSANGYDARSGEADGYSGCGEDGCLPELTRDGDTDDDESRWSCSSSLVPYGKACAITYTFKELQHIRSVQVAFLKPDDHPRGVHVAADGVDLGHIESSSESTFNLFGVVADEISTVTITAYDLTADEFLDILEVRILVQENHHD